MERVYVYKNNDENTRILGVSVNINKDVARIYILSNDKLFNCLEIRKKYTDEIYKYNNKKDKKCCR